SGRTTSWMKYLMMKYLIPSERSDVSEFIIHVFGNNNLPMKHAVRHTWLLHRLCTSRHILARVYHVHGKNCRSLGKSLNFFFTSRQLLTEYKFLLHLILVDKSQKS